MAKKRNIIVGQSGGPTSVINSSLAGVYKNAIERGFDKVYGMLHGIQGLLDEQYIDLSTQIHSELDIELLKRPPSAFLGSCRYKLPEIHEDRAIYEKIFDILNKLDIYAFIYIGGNDSMDTIKKLSDYAILTGQNQKFLGVPKTIDNDLALTDHTPGFGSAAKYIAASTKEVIRDAEGLTYKKSMITIMEIMGRNAGWLTGATALSKSEDCEGPDLIYLPEVPFDIEKFLAKVKDLLKKRNPPLSLLYPKESSWLTDAMSASLKRRRLCGRIWTQAATGNCHLSGEFPGCRVRLQDPCRRAFHPSEKRFPYGIPGGY